MYSCIQTERDIENKARKTNVISPIEKAFNAPSPKRRDQKLKDINHISSRNNVQTYHHLIWVILKY